MFGSRFAQGRRLVEARNSVNLIAAVTGQMSLKEVERYTREAEQERMADAAVDTMPERSDRKQVSSSPMKMVGQTHRQKNAKADG